MENAITVALSFNIGSIVAAQIGNPGESNYKPNCQVEILAVKGDSLGKPLYLVCPVDSTDFLAVASETQDPEIAGSLYSTNARVYGAGTSGEKFGFLTAAQAMKSLGF